MRSIRFLNLAFVTTILCAGVACNDTSLSVGEGGTFSTLPQTPTAVELSTALLSARYQSFTPTAKLKAKEFSRTLLEHLASFLGQTSGEEGYLASDVWNCPGGGDVRWQYGGGSTTFDFTADLNNCATSISLLGESYSETLRGQLTVLLSHTASGVQARNTVSLTINGDLGFSVSCDLSGQGSSSPFTLSGACIFEDAAGTRIEGSAEELKDLMFLGFSG